MLKHCGTSYSILSPPEDRKNYLPGWKLDLNSSDAAVNRSHPIGGAFVYQTGSQLNRVPVWGGLTTYNGGGYAVNLGHNSTSAGNVINLLTQYKWLDQHTRAVFIETNVLNMDSNLFSTVRLLYEFPDYGGCFTRHLIDTLELYRYTGGTGILAIMFELLSLLVFVVLMVLCVKEIVQNFRRKKQVFTLWIILRILLLTNYAISLIFYIIRTISTTKTLEGIMNDKGLY